MAELNGYHANGVRPHRRRQVVVKRAEAAEIPEMPANLSDHRRTGWRAFWASDPGRAARELPSGAETAFRLWCLYRDLDRVEVELSGAPAMVRGSMGQLRNHPLATRQQKLMAEIRQHERALGLASHTNAARAPEVQEDSRYLLDRMREACWRPNFEDPEYGGIDPRELPNEDQPWEWRERRLLKDCDPDVLLRMAAETLRYGRHVMSDLTPIAELLGVTVPALKRQAKAANDRWAKALLAAWRQTLAEARAEQVWVDPDSNDGQRVRARVDHYEALLADAEAHGVIWAQAPPWWKERAFETGRGPAFDPMWKHALPATPPQQLNGGPE